MKFKKFIYLFVVVFFFFGFYLVSYSQHPGNFPPATEQPQSGENIDEQPFRVSSPTSLNNPLGDRTPEILIGDLINTIFGIVGSLALLMFIYGGLTWMTSAGNKEMVDKGRNIIKWAAIGLVIIFSSYALVRFLIVGVGAA